VSFEEAADAFFDPNRVELFDEGHSEEQAWRAPLSDTDQCRIEKNHGVREK
jgi:hypothetical protein